MKDIKDIRKYQYSLRKNLTKAEILFEEKIKNLDIPYKKQMILGFYILDFVFDTKMICVEIDGSSHFGKEEYDEKRDFFVKSLGYKVIRIKNEEVENFDVNQILEAKSFDERPFRKSLSRANVLRGAKISNQKVKFKYIAYESL